MHIDILCFQQRAPAPTRRLCGSAQALQQAGRFGGVTTIEPLCYIAVTTDQVAQSFFNGRFIVVSDYVRMEVTLVDASWVVVAGDQSVRCLLNLLDIQQHLRTDTHHTAAVEFNPGRIRTRALSIFSSTGPACL